MAICCIIGCNSRSKGDEISVHRFPKNPVLRKAWLICINRKHWIPHKYAVVCSKHFEKKWFKNQSHRVHLIENAIPTLFPTHQILYDIEEPVSPTSVPPTYNEELECDQDTSSGIDGSADHVKCSDESDSAEDFMPEDQNAMESVDEDSVEWDENLAAEIVKERENSEGFSAEDLMTESQNEVESVDEDGMESVDEDGMESDDENVIVEMVKENSTGFSAEAENTVESTQAPPTIYRVIDATTESKEYFESQLKSIIDENSQYKKNIRCLQQKSLRLNNKIAKMENFVNSYRLNHVLSDAALEMFNSLPALDNELFNLQLATQSLQVPENLSLNYTPADEFVDTDVVQLSDSGSS